MPDVHRAECIAPSLVFRPASFGQRLPVDFPGVVAAGAGGVANAQLAVVAFVGGTSNAVRSSDTAFFHAVTVVLYFLQSVSHESIIALVGAMSYPT
jgi:hypothetical protein